MRLIDADNLKNRMLHTNRYFHIKYDIENEPTVGLEDIVKTYKSEIICILSDMGDNKIEINN